MVMYQAGIANCALRPIAGYLISIFATVRESHHEVATCYHQSVIHISLCHINRWHFGQAVEDTEILVIYSGAKGVPITLLKNVDPGFVAQCR